VGFGGAGVGFGGGVGAMQSFVHAPEELYWPADACMH
jgi:hypothetical protein